MKKWKALLAVLILVAGLAACTKKSTTQTGTQVPAVTRPPESDYDGFVWNPETLELESENPEFFVNGKNAFYDKENKRIVFTVSQEIKYSLTSKCDLAVSRDAFIQTECTLVTDQYPELCTENGYMGAAIQLPDDLSSNNQLDPNAQQGLDSPKELEPGNYSFVIRFDIYTIKINDYTVE